MVRHLALRSRGESVSAIRAVGRPYAHPMNHGRFVDDVRAAPIAGEVMELLR